MKTICFEKLWKAYSVTLGLHVPFMVMVGLLCLDINNWDFVLTYSAYFGLGFFVLTLILNPLKQVYGWAWVTDLNRYRRELGVASFSYVCVHLACFIIKRALNGFWEGLIYFFHPAIIPAFWIAFPILLFLTLTSNDYAVKRLKYKRWKGFHKSVYIAEIAIMAHLILTDNVVLMLSVFTPLVCLQGMRWRK
jgi:sulfoxide reductase heme-binding subunit YedZ